MKGVLLLIALFAIVVCGDRTILAGEDLFGRFAWIASLKYPVFQVPQGKTNSLFAAVFGDSYPGVFAAPPYVAVYFAHGSNQVTTNGTQFNGAATGMIWAYSNLGEYCETNNVPGYQPGQDQLIQEVPWDHANWNRVYAGLDNGVYWATLNESRGIFTFTCRVSSANRLDGGLTVNPYSLKCDVKVDATNFWAASTNCSDDKRYIGLLAWIAAGHYDNTNSVNTPDSSGQAGITFGGSQSFFRWKPTFEDTVHGNSYDVNAQVVTLFDGTLPNCPSETGDVKVGIFSFLSPKSQTSVFFWDPEMGVNSDLDSSAAMNQVVYAMIAMMLVFLVL